MDKLGPDFSTAQYWTEHDETGERLVMPIRRGLKVVGTALLGFGFALFKAHAVFGHEPGLFEYAVFAALGGGALFLVLNILTSLFAREVIQISNGELIHGWRLLGLKREKRYLLREIRGLGVGRSTTSKTADQLVSPLKDFGKAGEVSFDYCGVLIALGAGLDESHGLAVVNWIARRAPRSVLES
jgi:hypothetical protein